jgi:hypothetical protein
MQAMGFFRDKKRAAINELEKQHFRGLSASSNISTFVRVAIVHASCEFLAVNPYYL